MVGVGKHKRLDVLQPHLTDGSWEALLLRSARTSSRECPWRRAQVILPGGGGETWQVSGSVEHNVGGQPVYLACRMQSSNRTRYDSPAG